MQEGLCLKGFKGVAWNPVATNLGGTVLLIYALLSGCGSRVLCRGGFAQGISQLPGLTALPLSSTRALACPAQKGHSPCLTVFQWLI